MYVYIYIYKYICLYTYIYIYYICIRICVLSDYSVHFTKLIGKANIVIHVPSVPLESICIPYVIDSYVLISFQSRGPLSVSRLPVKREILVVMTT